jgi:tRNA(Ile)-lysidine synthetase-like protein
VNYLLAVSGGVDSVVLLDLFSKTNNHLVVAHVDHGIRGEESAADARFVKELAKKYSVPFVSIELNLAASASEELARSERYKFLLKEAARFNALLVTAHHEDDAVETIALNIERGTGWRGLMALNRLGIMRPLLGMTKRQIYDYAIKHHLEWVEDATNRELIYARNRMRHNIGSSSLNSKRLMELRARQLQLGHDIDVDAARLVARHKGDRHFLNMTPESVAIELLGAEIAGIATRPTRPRLKRALIAIKTAAPGSIHQIGDGISLEFTARNYTVRVI